MGTKFNADSRAKTRCYIVRDDTKEKFMFQFNPTSLPYGRTARFSEITSPGMSYPLTQYSGGDSRSVQVTLFYYDNPYSGKITSARQFLEGLLPPEYNTDKFIKPPTFLFSYGYFVKRFVLESLDVDDKWMNSDGLPIQTEFTLSMKQVGI